MKKLVSCLFLLSFCMLSVAQNNIDLSNGNNINKKVYKSVKKDIKSGDKLFYSNNPDYFKAKEYYLSAFQISKNDALLNYKLGKCFYYLDNQLAKFFLREADLLWNDLLYDSLVIAENSYMLADVYMLTNDFDSALLFYEKAELYDYTNSIDIITKVKKNQCIKSETFMESQQKVFVDSLPNAINAMHDNCNVIYVSIDNMLYFNSISHECRGMENDNIINSVELRHNGKLGKYAEVKSFGKLKPDDFLCDISPDGRFCIIAREGDLYVSTIDEDYSLGKLKKLPSQINTDADESYACFNTNMHYLYFVSDRKGGLGGKDIYRVSFIINKDDVFRFSDIVENLGKGINSKYDEISVSLLPFDNGMYVCSNRPDAFGGFDVYVAYPENQKWQELKNLGYPINTPADEIYYCPIDDPKHGFLTRSVDYKNADIFEVEFVDLDNEMIVADYVDKPYQLSVINDLKSIHFEDKLSIDEFAMAYVTGKIVDAKTGNPVGVRVELHDKYNHKIVASFSSNPSNGKYRISVPSGSDYYLIIVNSADYIICQEDINVPGYHTEALYDVDIQMYKFESGAVFSLEGIAFKDDGTLNVDASKATVNKVAYILKSKPEMTVEIYGKYAKIEQLANLLIDICTDDVEQRITLIDDYSDNISISFVKN